MTSLRSASLLLNTNAFNNLAYISIRGEISIDNLRAFALGLGLVLVYATKLDEDHNVSGIRSAINTN